MHKPAAAFAAAALCVAATAMSSGAAAQQPQGVPTFSRDVAPILYDNCVTCHRAGEAAPMSLVTFAAARPWARAIATAVGTGAMPPWHAEEVGRFENERRLSAAQKDVIARWAAGGGPEGDPKDLPARPAYADGWRIGAPDAVFAMLEDYPVPARGTVEYEYFYIPTNFTEAKWLQAIEVRPGARSLVHHVLVYYQSQPDVPGGPPALRLVPEHNRTPQQTTKGISSRPQQRKAPARQLLATYAPGTDPQVFRPGTALRLAPGGVIELQMHYTTTGTAGSDRTKVGLTFAKEPPAQPIRASQFLNASFTIPAGATGHQVDTHVEFLQDATVWGLFPHTHVRGKRWLYELELPDGTRTPLLSVPKYDFNWQTYYMFKEPVQVPKGAKIHSSAWYDNSAANRFNPDPKIDVKWGEQTWEEMQYTGLLYSARPAAGR